VRPGRRADSRSSSAASSSAEGSNDVSQDEGDEGTAPPEASLLSQAAGSSSQAAGPSSQAAGSSCQPPPLVPVSSKRPHVSGDVSGKPMSKKPDVGLFARGWDDEQLQQQLEHQRERLRRAEALQARAPSSLGTDEIQLFHSLNATQKLISRLEAEYDDRRTRGSDALSMMLSEALAPGTDLSSAAVAVPRETSQLPTFAQLSSDVMTTAAALHEARLHEGAPQHMALQNSALQSTAVQNVTTPQSTVPSQSTASQSSQPTVDHSMLRRSQAEPPQLRGRAQATESRENARARAVTKQRENRQEKREQEQAARAIAQEQELGHTSQHRAEKAAHSAAIAAMSFRLERGRLEDWEVQLLDHVVQPSSWGQPNGRLRLNFLDLRKATGDVYETADGKERSKLDPVPQALV